MYAAYQKIFRVGAHVPRRAPDTGADRRLRSHEFQVIANAGEDVIALRSRIRLRRQHRIGEAFSVLEGRQAPAETMEKRDPGKEKCEAVAEHLGPIFEERQERRARRRPREREGRTDAREDRARAPARRP